MIADGLATERLVRLSYTRILGSHQLVRLRRSDQIDVPTWYFAWHKRIPRIGQQSRLRAQCARQSPEIDNSSAGDHARRPIYEAAAPILR